MDEKKLRRAEARKVRRKEGRDQRARVRKSETQEAQSIRATRAKMKISVFTAGKNSGVAH